MICPFSFLFKYMGKSAFCPALCPQTVQGNLLTRSGRQKSLPESSLISYLICPATRKAMTAVFFLTASMAPLVWYVFFCVLCVFVFIMCYFAYLMCFVFFRAKTQLTERSHRPHPTDHASLLHRATGIPVLLRDGCWLPES